MPNKLSRRAVGLWQIGFILLATSWLWAPLLNHQLSYGTSLISHYESIGQPYAWLFRLCDIVSALLLLAAALFVLLRKNLKFMGALMLLIAIGLLIDPIIPTSCRTIGNTCHENISFGFLLHIIESTITSLAVFILSLHDYLKRKRVVTASFILIQFLYGVVFLGQVLNNYHFSTLSQYIYEVIQVLWLAWFSSHFLISDDDRQKIDRPSLIRNFFAIWALLNGVAAILISLAHINIIGHIHNIYFASDSAWLAQHGVIAGIVMIYLSRHLARGERRARQIFLLITLIEIFKYSVISPSWVLGLYLLTFCALFVSESGFDRGLINLTWDIRFKDAAFLLVSLLAVVVIAFNILDLDDRRALVTDRSISHFFSYEVGNRPSKHHLRSVLLADTYSAFLLASAGAILWILFRPQPLRRQSLPQAQVRRLLELYSNSTEDYFKLWPKDKNYFHIKKVEGFIAYKVVGPIAFALADPIARNSPLRQKLAEEFILMTRAKGLRTCFLPVYEPQLAVYQKVGLQQMQIGSSALIKVDTFLNKTSKDKWWRWKINRGIKSGYGYHSSVPPHPKDLLNQFKKVSDGWLGHAGRREYGFALGHFDKNYLSLSPVNYLTDHQNRGVAFVNQLYVFKPGATVTIYMLRYTPEVQDAMPYLLFNTIQDLSKTSVKYFDLGFVPFARAKGPILNIARTFSSGRFSAKGLEQFKNKFDPQWQSVYIAYDGDLADLGLIAVHLEKAMELS